MKAQFVYENINFERGGLDSREDILDRVLDRKIELELDAANVFLDDYGKVSRNVPKGELDTNEFFLDTIEKSGVQWKQLSSNYGHGGIPFLFRGTREQLIPVLAMWDAHSRDPEELAKELENWDGSESELIEILF